MRINSDQEQMRAVLVNVLRSNAWRQFTSNHGSISSNGYTLPELVNTGVSGEWDDNRVNRCLDSIRQFAETGDEGGAHNGSTFTARQSAIKAIWRQIRAAGVKDCCPRGAGGRVATKRHYYV